LAECLEHLPDELTLTGTSFGLDAEQSQCSPAMFGTLGSQRGSFFTVRYSAT
jgi:hypothetical protein